MGDPSIVETNTAVPARLIVELPALLVVAAEPVSAGDRRDPPGSLVDLLGEPAAAVIESDVLPALLRNEVWSGELPIGADVDRQLTALTLWVPHQPPEGPPGRATVLLGTSIMANAGRVAPDPLTDLPTRVVLLDRLDIAQRRSRRNADLLAALFVDLDGLKAINDRHGHEAGDAALRRAAVRIRSCLRDGDTVARFGGDEFVVLCESLAEEGQAQRVAERILEKLEGDAGAPLAASIGIAFDRGGELNALELIGRADAAMYRAKSRGGARFEVFDREMQGRIAADVALRRRLIDAIDGDGLDIAAQPLFELATGRILGVELFVRMRTNGEEIVDRVDLLRLARDRSEAVDAAMLGRAIAIARAWRRRFGRRCPRLHLNLSPQSLTSTVLVARVAAALSRHHVNPQLFAFEIDGRDLLAAEARGTATASDLRALGASVVLDGYGSGATPLALIDDLRPSLVKIPSADGTPQALSVEVITGLVRGTSTLGVPACVTGVASQSLLERVVRAGTHSAQGDALGGIGGLDETQRRIERSTTLGW